MKLLKNRNVLIAHCNKQAPCAASSEILRISLFFELQNKDPGDALSRLLLRPAEYFVMYSLPFSAWLLFLKMGVEGRTDFA
jgi:hypothetical protein